MTNRVAGPGIGLPAPQILYPASLYQIPYSQGSNEVSLAPGQSIQIPAGDFIIDLGKYSILQIQDPIPSGPTISQPSGVWRPLRTQRGTFPVRSDGVNYRIANLTGCAVSGIVTNCGKNYVAASTTITPSVGTSTWQPIIGGAIDGISCTVVGANYGLAPIVFIPAPPSPGLQATAVATITAGAITGFTVTNAGAGYATAPTITILPSPFDQNAYNGTAITTAVASAHLTGSGALTGALCTNPGIPAASTMTLTVAGAGTSATVSPVFLLTIASLTLSALGSGSFTAASLTTVGGIPSATSVWNQLGGFIPRPAQVTFNVASGNVTANSGVIVDGGLFEGNNSLSLVFNVYGGLLAGVAPTATVTQGSANDTVMVQPL